MITSIDRAVLRVMFQWVAIVALLGTPASSLSARRVLVVGGNGRVGGSTAKYLHLLSTSSGESPVELVLGGRSKETFKMSKQRILRQLADDSVKDLPSIEFQELDLDGPVGSLEEALQQCKAKCVVHTAGPFQQREDPALMRAAISCGLPYVDVCDEVALCEAGKKLDAEAKAKGTVAVVAGGIWPGASALMAAEVIAKLRELDAQGSSSGDSSGEMLEGPCEGEKVDLSFFTAGTGNAGATYLIVDGHPVHKSRLAKDFVARHRKRLRLILLPGYCPELNPDELLNQDVKTNAVGKSRPRYKTELMDTMRRYLHRRQKQPAVIRNLFREKHVRYAA